MKKLCFREFFFWFLYLTAFGSTLFAHEEVVDQDKEPTYTQFDFATELVKTWKLHRLLPIAPVQRDYVLLLQSYSISPLEGWRPKEPLKRGDFQGVLSRAGSRVNEYYQERQEFCDRIAEVIEEVWGEQNRLDGYYKLSKDLLKDERFFQIVPACPFGKPFYFDEVHHQVKLHHHVQPRWVKATLWGNEDWMHSKDGIFAP